LLNTHLTPRTHTSLTSCTPNQKHPRYYRGRGAFESMGAGLAMEPGDIAFKSNFATLNEATGVVERRRADRRFEHLGPTLCGALDGGSADFGFCQRVVGGWLVGCLLRLMRVC
jgi:2,3-bisphosphoglycerate-independent phosphoglycerate mutase